MLGAQDKLLVIYSVDYPPEHLETSLKQWWQTLCLQLWRAYEQAAGLAACLWQGHAAEQSSCAGDLLPQSMQRHLRVDRLAGLRMHGLREPPPSSHSSNAWGKVSHGIRLAVVQRSQLLEAVQCDKQRDT